MEGMDPTIFSCWMAFRCSSLVTLEDYSQLSIRTSFIVLTSIKADSRLGMVVVCLQLWM